jgi:hypothetical protein
MAVVKLRTSYLCVNIWRIRITAKNEGKLTTSQLIKVQRRSFLSLPDG